MCVHACVRVSWKDCVLTGKKVRGCAYNVLHIYCKGFETRWNICLSMVSRVCQRRLWLCIVENLLCTVPESVYWVRMYVSVRINTCVGVGVWNHAVLYPICLREYISIKVRLSSKEASSIYLFIHGKVFIILSPTMATHLNSPYYSNLHRRDSITSVMFRSAHQKHK